MLELKHVIVQVVRVFRKAAEEKARTEIFCHMSSRHVASTCAGVGVQVNQAKKEQDGSFSLPSDMLLTLNEEFDRCRTSVQVMVFNTVLQSRFLLPLQPSTGSRMSFRVLCHCGLRKTSKKRCVRGRM